MRFQISTGLKLSNPHPIKDSFGDQNLHNPQIDLLRTGQLQNDVIRFQIYRILKMLSPDIKDSFVDH